MKCLLKRIIVLFIVTTMLSACAGMNDSTRTKAEGTGIGAVIGGGLGYVIGRALGDEKLGTAIGAAVGGAAGYAAGSAVADKKQEYANEEDCLNGKIQVVAQYNKELDEYNGQMTQKIAALDQEISDVKSRYAEDESQLSALKDKQTEIASYIDKSNILIDKKNQELAALIEYQKTLQNIQNRQNVEKLENEMGVLKNNIAMLDKNNVQMAKLVETLNISK